MKRILQLALIVLVSVSCNKNSLSDISPLHLRCNDLDNPVGVNNIPEFNWIVNSETNTGKQTAFQIILDSDQSNLKSVDKCLWNSGKVKSSESVWIQYSGPELKPAENYFWKVKLWDQNNNESAWSRPASFITGLFSGTDWENAKWIGYEEIPDSLLLVPGVHGNGNNLGEKAKKRTVIPCFRKEFSLNKKISRALIFISGLGQYELYVNGERTGDRFLSPGWTNYKKTCLYNTYDITKSLKQGRNAIGAIVGNGFYNISRERYRKLVIAYGAPKMILKLLVRYADNTTETIVSDTTWETAPSPVTFSSTYGGEDYDARLEQPGWNKQGFNSKGWKNALLVREPEGELRPESDYPLKVMQAFETRRITPVSDSTFVYDFGQNASGIIKLTVHGKKGQVIRFIPGELIDKDSLVTQKASGEPFIFSYTLKGENEEIWTPRFCYYGFRYVQAEGAIPSGHPNPQGLPVISGLQFLHTRNSSPTAGSFRCSDQFFNSVYDLINWSIRSNLASVATDCPHREKLGWLEQTHLMGNSIRDVYDIHNLYNKVIDDMMESQLDNGLVPDISPEFVPFVEGFRDSPEWGSACIILPWDMYEWYGDINAVKKAYPMMKKYLGYLKGMSENYILSHGLGDWCDLGPNFPGEAQLTPKAVTATSIWFYDAKLLSKMADLTGNHDDASEFKKLAEEIRTAFNRKFFNAFTGEYSTGSQTAYSMPLYFGMVDDSLRKKVVTNLVNSINRNNKALTAGDIGFRYLLRALAQEGNSQLIYDMTSRADVPGYGYQLAKGATSLTESWAGLRDVSNNHMMLGHLMEWFYSEVGGIGQSSDSKGFEHIIIAPQTVGDLTWAETTYNSVHGEVLSSWKIENNIYSLKVKIPGNCISTIEIPQKDPEKISLNGTPVVSSGLLKIQKSPKGTTLIETGSGEYNFKTVL